MKTKKIYHMKETQKMEPQHGALMKESLKAQEKERQLDAEAGDKALRTYVDASRTIRKRKKDGGDSYTEMSLSL